MTSDAIEPPGAADLPDPADRGRLRIHERAVERIVTAAAAEVDGVGGSVRRVLGQSLGSADPDARPRAQVTLAGDLVTAEVWLSVTWPCSIPEVTGRVRDRCGAQLDRLARLRLSHADITVTALARNGSRRRVA